MTCDHMVGTFGHEPVNVSSFKNYHTRYIKMVEDFNNAMKSKSKRRVTPLPFQYHNNCSLCGASITWTKTEEGLVPCLD